MVSARLGWKKTGKGGVFVCFWKLPVLTMALSISSDNITVLMGPSFCIFFVGDQGNSALGNGADQAVIEWNSSVQVCVKD